MAKVANDAPKGARLMATTGAKGLTSDYAGSLKEGEVRKRVGGTTVK